MHLAASLNRPQIIEGIVHHKRHHLPSLVDHVSTTGETPLVVAVKAGHFASCDTLIQHGADPNKPDKVRTEEDILNNCVSHSSSDWSISTSLRR